MKRNIGIKQILCNDGYLCMLVYLMHKQKYFNVLQELYILAGLEDYVSF